MIEEEDCLIAGSSVRTTNEPSSQTLVWRRVLPGHSTIGGKALYTAEHRNAKEKIVYDYSVYLNDDVAELIVYKDGEWEAAETWNLSMPRKTDETILEGMLEILKAAGTY